MLKGLISKVVGDPNEREIRKLQPLVEAINALEPEMERRTDAELRSLTDRFRAQLAAGDDLDDLLVQAFAAVREAAKRTVDMRPFDVQLIGGIVLHQGKVAEMKTGEGKTLVATLPLYLNALLGRGVHLVTVNDYLARRDTLWMGPIYHFLGLSVGLLQSGYEQPAYLYDPTYHRDPYPGLRPVPRKEAYAADITYGTNNEFGFDYLRDNLALSLAHRVQRPLYYAIVDEVDNIFIDEARTPLIISGPSDEPVEEYSRFAAIARKLEQGVHYELDEKERSVFLTDAGLALVEQETGIENIYDEANYRYVHYMEQALKAQVLFQEGRDYIRQRKQIILVDHHTGRLMPDRRLSEGLHQAIEAKEGVPIRPRDVTSATITIQNYFRMYKKLAGMSGTAATEAEEFYKIYGLDVVIIPTHKPMIRVDHPDVIYRSEEAKLRAVAREILFCHSRGQPVLVGTTSVEMSERLSSRLSGERLQMAAVAPRVAYALQDAELDKQERARLREILNASLETMNPLAWRRMMRDLGLDPNILSDENLAWIAEYLKLPDDRAVRQALERALREGIAHQVLNAKEHTREASIIARAGEPGAVTIATNMAGRGVDIKLGGELSDEVIHRAHLALRARGLDPFQATPAQMDSAIAEVAPQYAQRREQVLAVGGLHILGTERHEARRIDNQLRGRSGRQGEPGSSRFYLSLEDDLMRRFGRREMLAKLMEQIGDDFPIEHGLVSKTIERAQTSVEGYNFDIRKHLLEYDDVLNRQRETIYGERLRILQADDLRPEVQRMLQRQVDEYVEKYGQDPTQRHLLFAALDDAVPLLLPAPTAPFQGPLSFAGHAPTSSAPGLTAFPPFTISFLADQLADRPLDLVQQTLRQVSYQAAADYGAQISGIVSQVAADILDKYEERLDRYRALLDEKIEDFLQLMEERGQAADARRLEQHLSRTYPLKLGIPAELSNASLDDLRDHWLTQVEVEFHRQTLAGMIDRIQIRLPEDIRLDRVGVAAMPAPKLTEELQRVLELAIKQPRDDDAGRRLAGLSVPSNPTPDQVLAFITTIKGASHLDFGRLDRLMGHLLGAHLHTLIGQYLDAVGQDEGRLRRDLERLRESVTEGKRGGRTDLVGLLRQLNDLVHLEVPDVEKLLSLTVAHEYDKWAQRQLADLEAEAERSPLTSTTWTAIAEHLLAGYFTQKQTYDREHRRHVAWAPRFPLGVLAQTCVADLDQDALRDAILDSLRFCVEQREQAWGDQELRRWGQLSLDSLGEAVYDSLIRYLGGQQLGEYRDRPVEELPADLEERLHFILALHQLEKQNLRLGDLPQAERLLARMGQALADQVLDTPIHDLDAALQEQILSHLRQAGLLDNPQARDELLYQPIHDWDERTRDEVTAFLGRRFIAAHQDRPVADLPDQAREMVLAHLQARRAFVDEEQVQRFLVHGRLSDLPPDRQWEAVLYLARARLDRLSKRKISNLDIKTRQVVIDSLQRQGLFTDQASRDTLQAHPLDALRPEVREGFARFLARQQYAAGLAILDTEARRQVVDRLKRSGALSDPDQIRALPGRRLSELDGNLAAQIRKELIDQTRADLSAKTMEELPAEVRSLVHQALDERGYFVDQEKVGWYERKTLAQLPGDLLRGLEQHLGRVRLAEMLTPPFRSLPAGTQSNLLAFFDSEGLLTDRAERLRLTQAGSLAELPEEVRRAIALHLGRQWLVEIRSQRPANLPDRDREVVWAYLRDQGYFADEFKEELFPYQRLDEFDAETRRVVERTVAERLTWALDRQPIGELPAEIQAAIHARLVETGYFVDPDRLRQAEELPIESLPADLQPWVEAALGEHLLADLNTTPLAELPAQTQAALWRYLDEIGYFVDETRRSQLLERRLADLASEQREAVVQDLARQIAADIGDRPVAELDDELRQGLREALEVLGHFESAEERARGLAQPLGNLRREDLDLLAGQFGQAQMAAWAERRLSDLPPAEREAILAHLQARNWFLDRDRFDQLQNQRLRDLQPDLQQELLTALQQQQADHLRRQRLSALSPDQRRAVYEALREERVPLPTVNEGQMRSLRRQKVADLEPDIYHALLRDLGQHVIAGWGATRFQDLPPEQQALLGAYLGRQIMGRIERRVLLYTISRLWIDYLTDIEDLRRGIGLEAYGQRDPLVEYKRKAFELFEELSNNIRRTVVRSLFRQSPEPAEAQ